MMKTRAELDAELIARVTDDDAFRARFLENPREIIQEVLGIAIPEDFTIHVHEEDSMSAHIVLPASERLTEEDLSVVAGGMAATGFWV